MEIKGLAILLVLAILWFIFKPLLAGIINGLTGSIGRIGTNTQNLTTPKLKVDNINLQNNTFSVLDIETGKELTYRTIVIRIIGTTQETKKVIQTKCISKDSTDMVQFVTEPDPHLLDDGLEHYTYSKYAKLEYTLENGELSIFIRKKKSVTIAL